MNFNGRVPIAHNIVLIFLEKQESGIELFMLLQYNGISLLEMKYSDQKKKNFYQYAIVPIFFLF